MNENIASLDRYARRFGFQVRRPTDGDLALVHRGKQVTLVTAQGAVALDPSNVVGVINRLATSDTAEKYALVGVIAFPNEFRSLCSALDRVAK